MKPSELREMSVDQLQEKERDFRQEQFKLRFQHAAGQLEKTSRLKTLKREIARVKTIMREKRGTE